MSFDYDKMQARHEEEGNSWTAYSDLFLMLSTVFLLLYVASSFRSHTSSIQQNQEYQKLSARAADLEQQIQVYNALRDNQVKNSSEQEQQVYEKLTQKLTLLQEEAKNEKDALRKQAKENEDKEYALNEYQKLVRNIINTNILAKTQIKRRDTMIVDKNESIKNQAATIANQEQQIGDLNTEIARKQATLAANRARIKEINKGLNAKIAELKNQREELNLTKRQMDEKIAELKHKSAKKVRELESQNQAASQELNEAQKSLASAQQAVQKGEAEKEELKGQLAMTKQQYEYEVKKLKGDHATRLMQERAAFDASLAKERMTGAEKAKRIAEYAALAQKREKELQSKLGDLGAKYQQAESDKGRALATVEGLSKQNKALSSDLKHAQEVANARAELARKIKAELAKAGIGGSVDGKMGDVTLAFGEEYFDTGRADLKPNMKKTLEKFMPGYSRSLFNDPKIAEQIENVEIIGFASSTYRGRYVPPDSLKPEDQEAVNHNLKLSFNRANAIFKYIFDTQRMSFEHQRDLLPKIKVVGRGYLPDGKSGKDFAAGMPENEFCSKYNCKQAQKVIIKFKLKD